MKTNKDLYGDFTSASSLTDQEFSARANDTFIAINGSFIISCYYILYGVRNGIEMDPLSWIIFFGNSISSPFLILPKQMQLKYELQNGTL